MTLPWRLAKLEKIGIKKSRRFLVRYDNPESGLPELTDLDIDDYTKTRS